MDNTNKIKTTALFAVAIVFCGLLLVNCVTPRHIDDLKAQIRNVEENNRNTQEMVAHMDSVITTGAEADNRLRNSLNTSMAEIQGQISALMENYNDLLTQLNKLSAEQNTKYRIKSSPGSSTPTEITIDPQTTKTEPAFDCDLAYDNAFLLVTQSEYEKGITQLNEFIQKCPAHQSVENAHYWTGESYYSLNKFVEAIEKFNFFIDKYKASVYSSRALYQIARSSFEIGKTADAKKFYQRVIDEHPQTLEAKQAKERLKDIK